MPGSSADTFWGKGFLATALGTASPDRKKTHKGQRNVTSSSGVTSSASTERTEAFSMSSAFKDFQQQVINIDLQPFLNVFILSFQKSDESLLSQLLSSLHDFPSIQEAGCPPPVKHDSSWGVPSRNLLFSLEMCKTPKQDFCNSVLKGGGKHPVNTVGEQRKTAAM